MSPAEFEVAAAPPLKERARGVWKRYKWFTIVVLLPILIVAIYLWGFASDQYESEAHYLVRTQGAPVQQQSGGLSSLFGGGGGGGSIAAAGESVTVQDYLQSHDVVEALRKRLDLVAIFRRPEADPISRLSVADPTPELLLRYYRNQVDVYFDAETGITTLTSRAFRRQDAHALTTALLALGERRVNEMNVRAYRDAVALSQQQLDEAERALRAVGGQITAFRQTERDASPETTATSQTQLLTNLQAQLSAARAQLSTITQMIGGDNPQAQALRQQIRSLEEQLSANTARVAGGTGAIAAGLGNYEALKMRQEFLAQRYAAASTVYEQARQQAVRQQLYVVRVVNPNVPVKSTYPTRSTTLITLLVALLVLYAIGWLIAAGVREHSV